MKTKELSKTLQQAAQKAFADYPVISAYLYGSQVGDRNLSTSDIDVAVYIDPEAFPLSLNVEQKIAKWFSMENRLANYIYDFGDGWEHTVKLEKILPRENGVNYPICIGGKRACPPEDYGGIWGYEQLLDIVSDKNHEEHEEMMEWLGGEFDPEHFDVEEVRFDDPDKRRKIAFM